MEGFQKRNASAYIWIPNLSGGLRTADRINNAFTFEYVYADIASVHYLLVPIKPLQRYGIRHYVTVNVP